MALEKGYKRNPGNEVLLANPIEVLWRACLRACLSELPLGLCINKGCMNPEQGGRYMHSRLSSAGRNWREGGLERAWIRSSASAPYWSHCGATYVSRLHFSAAGALASCPISNIPQSSLIIRPIHTQPKLPIALSCVSHLSLIPAPSFSPVHFPSLRPGAPECRPPEPTHSSRCI